MDVNIIITSFQRYNDVKITLLQRHFNITYISFQ